MTFLGTGFNFGSFHKQTDGWVSYFDDTYWVPLDGTSGTWNGTQWVPYHSKATYILQLNPLGGWEVGFRPSYVRITFTISGPFQTMTLRDNKIVNAINILNGTVNSSSTYISGDEVLCQWDVDDLGQFSLVHPDSYIMTNFEWLL